MGVFFVYGSRAAVVQFLKPMNADPRFDSPYLSLAPEAPTPGRSVAAAGGRTTIPEDAAYLSQVEDLRFRLASLATRHAGRTTVLFSGGGVSALEATLGGAIPRDGKLLTLSSGASGRRIAAIADRIGIECRVHDSGENLPPDLSRLELELKSDERYTHVAAVLVEGASGLINPIREIAAVVRKYGKRLIVDAGFAFGGVELDAADSDIDFLVGDSAGALGAATGLGFVVAPRTLIEDARDRARSFVLDLYAAWSAFEKGGGRFRFDAPIESCHSLAQALNELDAEGGIDARAARFAACQRRLCQGMRELGFKTQLAEAHHSGLLTSFLQPDAPAFQFDRFYADLKLHGFLIAPGLTMQVRTFRMANLGPIANADIDRLLVAVEKSRHWLAG